VKHHLQENEWSYAKIIGMVQEWCGRNCASLVSERYGENKDELIQTGGSVAAAGTESHDIHDAQRGNHQEDMDGRI
jgi:hypothetical protein